MMKLSKLFLFLIASLVKWKDSSDFMSQEGILIKVINAMKMMFLLHFKEKCKRF